MFAIVDPMIVTSPASFLIPAPGTGDSLFPLTVELTSLKEPPLFWMPTPFRLSAIVLCSTVAVPVL